MNGERAVGENGEGIFHMVAFTCNCGKTVKESLG
jgi:hypothetical protein